MKHAPVSWFLSFAGILAYVVAVPVPLSLTFDPKYRADLKQLFPPMLTTFNNIYIPAMEKLLRDREEKDDLLQMAFGVDWKTQLNAIQAGVETLKTGSIDVVPNELPPGAPPHVLEDKVPDVREGFPAMLGPAAIPTSANEASNLHARGLLRLGASVLLHGSDYFKKVGGRFEPSTLKDGHTHSARLKVPKAFKNLRKEGGAATCVKMLDAWMLFGHLAVHGDVDFRGYSKSLWSLDKRRRARVQKETPSGSNKRRK